MKIDIQKLINNKEYCETAFKHYIKRKMLRKTNPELFGFAR